jgi:hypothetical protein
MTDRIILRPSADVLPLLAGMIDALGTAAAASLPGADRAQVSQWTAGTEPVSAEMGRRIVDLHAVLAMEGAYT